MFRFILLSLLLAYNWSATAKSNTCESLLLQSRALPAKLVEEVQLRPDDVATLEDILIKANDPHFIVESAGQDWSPLVAPQLKPRPRGLFEIQQFIKRYGLHIAIGGETPDSPARLRHDQYIHQAGVLYHDMHKADGPMQFQKGVILHSPSAGDDVRLFNAYRGDLNITLGWGWLNPLLQDKLTENKIANAVWPGVMAAHRSYGDLLKERILRPDFESKRRALASQLSKIMKKARYRSAEKTVRSQIRQDLLFLITELFAATTSLFADGAFVKNYHEMASGDYGNQITTDKSDPEFLVDEFLNRLSQHRKPVRTLTALRETLFSVPSEMGAQFIYRFLTDPEPIIFQERLQIARTPLNQTYEFRVDFIDCEPMNSFPRYTQEYLDDGAVAEMVLREFCKRAPEEFQYLSGGADVAKLADGTWKIIEFNFGANSGGMDPYLYTIPYHQMISRLTGVTSELLTKLDEVYRAGPAAQSKYILKHRFVLDRWEKYHLNELSRLELAVYFRNRYLQEYEADPTPENLQRLRRRFKRATREIGRHQSILDVLAGFDSYVETQKRQ